MKILIVMSGGFDTYGPSRHLYQALIEDFLKKGHAIHLIESHSSGIDDDCPLNVGHNPNFSFETVPTRVVPKKKFVKRYLTGLKYTFDCKKVLKNKKYKFDIALVQSCVWAPFMVTQVKKIVKALTVWNIQDMFPGASIANGVMKNKLMKKIFFWLHKRAYKNADYITVISEDMKNKVIEQGYKESNICVINDWYDDNTVKEVHWKNNRFVKKYSIEENKFYVQYAGTMGFNFDYKIITEVASRLSKFNNIQFQMIGFGSQLNQFKNEVVRRNLNNIIFYPLQAQELVSDVYSACNVCIIPLPLNVIGNSVPSKIALLMACKRPVISIANKDSCYINMINKNCIGYGFGNEDIDKISESILYLEQNRHVCKQMGINAYNYGKVIYSRSFNTDKYINFFEEIVKKHENSRNNTKSKTHKRC